MTLSAEASLDAVIFDLDGTLVDTAPEFISVIQGLRKRHELPLLPEETIRQTVTNGAAALVSLAL
ncbi:MAG: HAD hydrolase-like protein, partial [Halieaceae bacterium]